MTYDRKLVKFDGDALQDLHAALYAEPSAAVTLLPAAHDGPQPWLFTLQEPRKGWEQADFRDRRWADGEAPFRSQEDPLFANGTEWTTDEIWIRREFEVEELPSNLWLEILHSVRAGEVFLNGVKVDDLENLFSRREYRHQDISAHLDALQVGRNVIAIRAQVGENPRDDPKSLDAGLYSLE